MAMAIAAAGRCVDGVIRLTNAPWVLTRADLTARLDGIPVELMNDLAASAHALTVRAPGALMPIGEPPSLPVAQAGKLVINVGTGFAQQYSSIAILDH